MEKRRTINFVLEKQPFFMLNAIKSIGKWSIRVAVDNFIGLAEIPNTYNNCKFKSLINIKRNIYISGKNIGWLIGGCEKITSKKKWYKSSFCGSARTISGWFSSAVLHFHKWHSNCNGMVMVLAHDKQRISASTFLENSMNWNALSL